MTPEAQRIAIAEACGWKLEKASDGHSIIRQPSGEVNCSDPDPSSGWSSFVSRLPDYLSDLNAMHEAEKVLTTQDQKAEYFYQLNNTVGLVEVKSPAWIIELSVVAISNATAPQRAEAFLRTLNLWKD